MNQTATLIQSTTISPEDKANWQADIAEGIKLLNEQERLVMALHYHEDLTVAEIAQVLEISIRKVEKIRDSTLQKLLSR